MKVTTKVVKAEAVIFDETNQPVMEYSVENGTFEIDLAKLIAASGALVREAITQEAACKQAAMGEVPGSRVLTNDDLGELHIAIRLLNAAAIEDPKLAANLDASRNKLHAIFMRATERK